MRQFVLAILLVLTLAQSYRSSSVLQCKGEKNQDVDWFLLYKLPRLPKSSNKLIKQGVAYLYMDSSSYKYGWTLSSKDISKNNSIPAYTLSQFYDDKSAADSLWILYNDQPPNLPARLTNGHAKGAVITDGKEGFWLIHSVPNFPPRPNTGEDVSRSKTDKVESGVRVDRTDKDYPSGGYSYPSSGRANGQSFLCVSTSEESFNSIGKQLMYNQIVVYRRNMPKQLIDKFTTLVDAAKQVRVRSPPYYRMANFNSKNGMKFTSFAKSSKWDRDLYDDFVAVELNADLYTETWMNGRGKLPSDCNATRVMNVQSISLPKAGVSFKSTHDHSKWAVSIDGKSARSWVCVGDINRADTQFERGGGTVCLNLPEVWKSYRDSVDDVEPCPMKRRGGLFKRIESWIG
ncbi:plancitoxin-1-like [Trichogramma pretiosum]|uniref:plancitoxin-1-like n=1 Tax=Trichogramma pretiosum TaxID=7493 RepID=UPI0006C9D254|nr:plancitoxin-1-like [Trichogramma pretiosum]